jgi:hypothetical protein
MTFALHVLLLVVLKGIEINDARYTTQVAGSGKPLRTLLKEKKATLVPSTVKFLSQQIIKALSEMPNRIPEGENKS